MTEAAWSTSLMPQLKAVVATKQLTAHFEVFSPAAKVLFGSYIVQSEGTWR
jgi:hypothetical protein